MVVRFGSLNFFGMYFRCELIRIIKNETRNYLAYHVHHLTDTQTISIGFKSAVLVKKW